MLRLRYFLHFVFLMASVALTASSNAILVGNIGQSELKTVHLGEIDSPGTASELALDLDSLPPVADSISDSVSGSIQDSLVAELDSIALLQQTVLDSLAQLGIDADSILADSVLRLNYAYLLTDTLSGGFVRADTSLYVVSDEALEDDVDYDGDTIFYDLSTGFLHLRGNASVQYQDFDLKAHYIGFDWNTKTVIAYGGQDTVGRVFGKPDFQDGDQNFTADTIRYNFGSRKGKIFNMVTEEQGGQIQVSGAKMINEDEIFGSSALYTTCTNQDPHFHIQTSKMKVVPNKLIVTGPANLVIEDIPTPLVLPFAIFPLKKDRHSGILLPQYGESQQFGFYLQDGGYYFAINDYVDMTLRGDIYSRGSWRAKAASSYRRKYRYSGNINATYANLRFGSPSESDFQVTRDFRITWSHRQDAKARPNSNFSANVNVGTSTFNTNATTTVGEFLDNSLNSSITYTKTFAGKPYNLGINLRHSQSSQTRRIDLTLPDLSFNVSRVQPFKKKISSGTGLKWYENIGISYTGKALNRLSTVDSLLFEPGTLDEFEFGVSHRIPVSSTVKLFKYFSLSPSFNYTEYWYPNYIQRRWTIDTLSDAEGVDSLVGLVQTDTISGFRAARFFDASINLSTQLYSTVTFKKGKLKALRHRISPSIGFNYRPDFGAETWNYYGEYVSDWDGSRANYSKFENGLFGSPPTGEIGGISFSINSSLEAKVFSKADTIKNEKKIGIFDALNFSTFYNFALDSFQLSNFTISGRTRLLDRFDINFSTVFDPYSRDSLGIRQRQSEWSANRRPARFSSGRVAASTRFSGGRTAEGKDRPRWLEWDVWEIESGYADFNVPWSFNINYNLNLTNTTNVNGGDSLRITQSMTLNGSFNLTPKWKASVQTGYDFQAKELTLTTIKLDRDLHCWQMGFTWIPFGTLRSYNFTLNVKSAVLQQLRINRRQDWYDEY